MGIISAVNLIFNYIRHDDEKGTDEVTEALKGVSLDIEEGTFVAILGHNGSGKSTFAKLMNGILLPSDGTVFISGMKTDDEEHLWDVRKTAGMVFQNRTTRSSATWLRRTWASGRRTWASPRTRSGGVWMKAWRRSG